MFGRVLRRLQIALLPAAKLEREPWRWRYRRNRVWIALRTVGGAAAVLAVMGLAIWVLPPAFVQGQLAKNPTTKPTTAPTTAPTTTEFDRPKAINDVRAALVTALGVLAVSGGSVIAYLNFRRTLELNRRGQVTERFSKAVDQLGQAGGDKLDIRIGAIYALEQIAKDSADLHWPVMQVLTAFLREHAAQTANDNVAGKRGRGWPLDLAAVGWGLVVALNQARVWRRRASNKDLISSGQCSADSLAVADVIRRRRPEWDPVVSVKVGKPRPREPLNLRGCYLRTADLSGAFLVRATLETAELQGARFGGAQLLEASFRSAQLRGAWFQRAILQGATFEGAGLEEVYFGGAHLRGAKFRGARLQGASFGGAQLQGADLSEARGLTQSQLDSAICDTTTKIPEGLSINPKTPTNRPTRAPKKPT
jgi:hypothetical protein